MRLGRGESGGCFPTGRHYPGIAHLLRVSVAGLVDEHGGEHPVMKLPLVSIDTETTGKSAATDRIVEIACVFWRDGAVSERRSWLVNPERSIPKESFDIHGISDDDVRAQPTFAQILPELLAALHGVVPVAYNADFDRGILHAELERAQVPTASLPPAARKGVEWLDPLTWARELQKTEKSRALTEVCARLGIRIERAHRATDDAEAALLVLAAFADDSRVPRTYAAFIQEQRRLGRLFDDERRMWR